MGLFRRPDRAGGPAGPPAPHFLSHQGRARTGKSSSDPRPTAKAQGGPADAGWKTSPSPIRPDPADEVNAAHDAWSDVWDDSGPPAEPDVPEPDWDELADLAEAQDRYEAGCLF